MDLLQQFLAQLGALKTVWIPFLVAVVIVAVVVWKCMEWRFRGIIDGFEHRLELRDEKLEYLEQRGLERPDTPVAVPHEHKAEQTKSPSGQTKTYVPEGVDPDYLRNLYRENTSVQSAKLAAPYIGKWIKIEAEVVNVVRYVDSLSVSTRKPDCDVLSPESLRGIYLTFHEDTDQVEMLRRGDKLRAEGRIKEIGPFDITLDPARLSK